MLTYLSEMYAFAHQVFIFRTWDVMQNTKTCGRPASIVSRLDWDDLRYVLAVARCGSLSGAARALAVRHSTMLRRIDAIEERLQTRLFERLRSGYVTTEAGDILRQAAECCEPLVSDAERRIAGGDRRLTGNLRVSTGFVIAQFLLPQALSSFHGEYPSIEVEVQTSREVIDLSRRDADVAIRFSADVPEYLVGRKLGEVRFRVYARRGAPFLAGRGDVPVPLPLERIAIDYPWICLQREARDRAYDRWMHKHVPQTAVVARADHFPTSLALIRTGLGVALLPEFMASGADDLAVLSAPVAELQNPLWILTHPDLRNTARVRAFMQLTGAVLQKALEGCAAET